MRTIIVSAANEGFAPLVLDLAASIGAVAEHRFALGLLDLGLDPSTRAQIQRRGVIIADPGADLPGAEAAPRHWRAFTARPFLPRYFPGYETYLWLDADTWVQDACALDWLVEGARRDDIAIVPEVDRAYREWLGSLKIKTVMGIPRRLKSWAYDIYRAAYGGRLARELAFHPLINNGVFAMRASSPGWAAWIASYREGLGRTRKYGLDQLSLNHAIHTGRIRPHYLPASCNWLAQKTPPLWDTEHALWVEPYLPHRPIGILHLTNRVKSEPVATRTLAGTDLTTPLTFTATRALLDAASRSGVAKAENPA